MAQECFTNEHFSKYFHLITGFAFSNLTAREPRYRDNVASAYLRTLEAYVNNKGPIGLRRFGWSL